MPRVESSVLINRRPEVVWAFGSQFERNYRSWNHETVEVRVEGGEPASVGSKIHFVTQLLGRRFVTVATVAQWEEPRVAVFHGVGDLTYEATIRCEWSGGGTRATRVLDSQPLFPGFLGKVLEPVTKIAAQHQNSTALRALKALVEAESES